MDSFTQIVLGAAVGELAAGKQLGNRAMWWGALAGTIPDLDVSSSLVADPITGLAFHRCVTHSLFYAALASPLLAWMVQALYPASGEIPERWPVRYGIPATLAVYLVLVFGSYASPTPLAGVWVYSALVAALTVVVPWLVWGFRQNRSRRATPHADYRHWLMLFALGIGTHPLLDCFTTYGTQLLQPFDELRVAWNTISVVDPAYTLPFLVCLLAASRLVRDTKARRAWTWAGVLLSTGYLAFTGYHLLRVRNQVAADLAAADIPYERFIATPTLFQNVLWSVAIDQGDTLRLGRLGYLDEPFRLDTERLMAFPRRRELIDDLRTERAVGVATWFSDGYYTVSRAAGDTLELVDLRFGLLPGEGASPLFAFQLFPPAAPGEEWGFRQRPLREDLDYGRVFGQLWNRVRGGEVDAEIPMRGGEED